MSEKEHQTFYPTVYVMYTSIRKILRVLRFCSRKPICQEDFMLVSLLVPELWKTIHHHKKNPIGTSKTSTSQAQIKFPMSTFWWLNMTCAMRGKKHEKLEDSHIYSSGLSTTRTTHYLQKANKIVTIYDFARLRRNMKFLASRSQICYKRKKQ